MTRSRVARILLAVVFTALLATPLVVKRLLHSSDYSAASADGAAVMARYGFRLEEVAKASGIDFLHQAPVLDSKLDHIMPQVASMGAAVSIVDFDRDGWQDLYVTNSREGSKNCLYKNQGDGSFKNVATEMNVADLNEPGAGVSMGAVW